MSVDLQTTGYGLQPHFRPIRPDEASQGNAPVDKRLWAGIETAPEGGCSEGPVATCCAVSPFSAQMPAAGKGFPSRTWNETDSRSSGFFLCAGREAQGFYICATWEALR